MKYKERENMENLKQATGQFLEVAESVRDINEWATIDSKEVEKVLIQLYNEKRKELNNVINGLDTNSGYLLYDGRIEDEEGDIIDYGEADELYDDIYKALGDDLGYFRNDYNIFDITIYNEYDITEYNGFSSLPVTFGNIRHHQGNAMFSSVDNFMMFNNIIYLLDSECEELGEIGQEL